VTATGLPGTVPAARERIEAAIVDALVEYATDGMVRAPMPSVVVSGTKP
jgi:hypothetical protein